MRYKIFGKSGLRVSELALGTMTFGEEWGWGANKEESKKVFDLYCAKYRPGPGTDLMVSKDGRRVAFSGARRNSADLVTAICSLDFKRKELVPLYEIRGEYSMEQYFKA